MKTLLTASFSVKSNTTSTSSATTATTTTTMEEDRTESRDSCYYPGCKKDANCNCAICLASINATLDLMPFSIQKSSLTKFSASRPSIERTPVSMDSSIMSTPRSSSFQKMETPILKSTAKSSLHEKMEKRKRTRGFGGVFSRLVLGLSLIFVVEFGFSSVVSGVLRPELSRDIVRNVGERSWVVQDLNGRLRFLQNELKGLVDGKISNCSYTDSKWEINQDGLLLISRCTLYKSAMEEVSIWGWPLQTAGLLTTGFSSGSFTILSGRVTEWSNGKVGFSTRKANTSWVQRKWGASVMQLNPNTWVLEYRRSPLLDNSRLFLAALELLKYSMSRVLRRMNEEFWLFSAFENQYSGFTAKDHIMIPT